MTIKKDQKAKNATHPKFNSIEELMAYVEKEAEKRADEIIQSYRKLMDFKPYDEVILKVLGESGEPLSIDTISFLTGINKPRCCKILKNLEVKWGLVRKATVSKTAYYERV